MAYRICHIPKTDGSILEICISLLNPSMCKTKAGCSDMELKDFFEELSKQLTIGLLSNHSELREGIAAGTIKREDAIDIIYPTVFLYYTNKQRMHSFFDSAPLVQGTAEDVQSVAAKAMQAYSVEAAIVARFTPSS